MAGNEIMHANTDLLKDPTLRAYGDELQRVINDLQAEVAACLPLAKVERDDSDTKLRESVNNQVKYINFLLGELRDLSKGNADQVVLLGQILDDVEDQNHQVASFDGTGTKH